MFQRENVTISLGILSYLASRNTSGILKVLLGVEIWFSSQSGSNHAPLFPSEWTAIVINYISFACAIFMLRK